MTTDVTAREYLRVSQDRSGRERSQDEQSDDNARAAARNGWTLGKPYREKGSASASRYTTKVRDAFASLLADLTTNRFAAAVLILWESSRGSRRVGEWVTLIELCEERGVRIYVTSDDRTYDPADPRDRRELLADAIDSEYESAKVSKRAKRSAAAGAVAGRPNGITPYGYRRRYDPVTRKLVAQEEEPAEATIVRELFDRLHGGHSLRAIASDLNGRGVRTRTGLVFSTQHLRSMALSRAYVGERVHDPERTTRTTPTAAMTVTAATWPALIDRATWLAVDARLRAPERVTTRPGRAVHLLSMLARCDVCSGPVAVRTGRAGLDYACHIGGHVRVSYDDLNDHAEQVMLGYLSRPDNVARLVEDRGDSAALAAARDTVAEIRAELADLARQVGAGRLSATLAAAAEPGIMARLRDAEQTEKALATPPVLRGLIEPGTDVARRWKAAPMSTRREVVKILCSPELLGELRVTRTATPGHRCPIVDRVIWQRG
jgi:DNA invertase Pin-like site-specific DNA recombinase